MDISLQDVPELEAQGVTFLDAVGPVKINGRNFELRWLTTARDDMPARVQLQDLTKIQSLQALVSIEDVDSTLSVVIKGRTIGLGKRRALNFTARGIHLNALIPRGSSLPHDLWLDIILGAPFLNPDGPVEGHLVMPMDAKELRELGFTLRQQQGEKAKDAVHTQIAAIRQNTIPIHLTVKTIHPAVRRRIEEIAHGPWLGEPHQPSM